MFLIELMAFWVFIGVATHKASDDGDDLLPPPHAYESDFIGIDVFDRHPVGHGMSGPSFDTELHNRSRL